MAVKARARELGAQLRRLREDAQLSVRELGAAVGWGKSTVSRVECGERIPTETEVAALLGALGVPARRCSELFALARLAREPAWWEVGTPGLPRQLTALIGFESAASRITEFSATLVPGLVQTADYATKIMSLSGLPRDQVETRVRLRMGRQEILTRRSPAHFCALIDEAVLCRPVGSPEVMADQLHHLLDVSQRPNVSVQVLPFAAGEHVAMDGSYVLLEYPTAGPIVHIEQYRTGAFLDESPEVDDYVGITEVLKATAMTEDDSVKLVRDYMKNYRM